MFLRLANGALERLDLPSSSLEDFVPEADSFYAR